MIADEFLPTYDVSDAVAVYWALGVGSGAHVLVTGALEQTRDRAECEAARTLRAQVPVS